MMQNPILEALSAAGMSVWLDDLSRDRLTSGNLQQLIDTRSVVGVTTNPTIFQHAISHGQAYTRQLTELAERGADADLAKRTARCASRSGGVSSPTRASSTAEPSPPSGWWSSASELLAAAAIDATSIDSAARYLVDGTDRHSDRQDASTPTAPHRSAAK